MLTRYQVMAIATAIARHEHEVFGDSCLITNLTDLIRKSEQEMEYYHADPLEALKQAEGAMTDVINLIDQANDDRSYNVLGKQGGGTWVSLFSGTRLTDRDIVRGIDGQVRKIVRKFSQGIIDEPDCSRQLVDLLVRAVQANTRRVSREGEE